MAYTFSTDQQAVIDSRNANVIVSAAAGSGKTSVMTERIVSLVLDKEHPIDIDRVLVVTFTNAAAGEMKERIAARINALIASNPTDAHLQKQATLIHSAMICTIDSFCLNLVRNHFHVINLDPSFRIGTSGELELLKQDALKDVIRRAYDSGDEVFYNIVDCFSGKSDDEKLEEIICNISKCADGYPWPEKWLDDHMTDYEYGSLKEFADSPFVADAVRTARSRIREALKLAKDFYDAGLVPDRYAGNFEEDINSLEELFEKAESLNFEKLSEKVNKFEFGTLSRKRDNSSEEALKQAKDVRGIYKDIIKDLKVSCFAKTLEQYYEDTSLTSPVNKKLLALTKDFTETFSQAKRDRGIVDFSDLEHMAVKILIKDYKNPEDYTPTDVALSYRKFFETVMVDEYQDVNLIQELIIQSVSREKEESGKNRFMVGDVKQSIYRFRQARPEIFIKKSESYSKEETSPDRLITLKANYRSRQAVVDSVNDVFADIMVREKGGVEYDEDARLYMKADYTPDASVNKTEVVLIESDGNSQERMEISADAICQTILRQLDETPVTIKNTKELRTAKYSDIAVLIRSPKLWLAPLKASFEKYHIPYHLEGVGTFYDSFEISQVIEFLKILNNPLDDIALYASLTSFFGGLSDEECAYIKVIGEEGGRHLWDKLNAYLKEHPDDEKVNDFLALYNRYRGLSKVCPIHELISKLFDETGYKNMVSAMPGGKQRLANVEMLIVKANEYAKTSFFGLFHFIRYIELIKKVESEEGEANTFDESANVVRIMTIHKSKGLEFPICIVGAMDREINDNDWTRGFLTDFEKGIGINYVDPERRIKRSTLIRKVISDKIKTDSLGEEARVLYVAMTRAREKLILMGSVKDYEGWIEGNKPKTEKSYLDMIQGSVLSHRDRFEVRPLSESDIELSETSVSKPSVELAAKEEKLFMDAEASDKTLANEISKRFNFKYPYTALSKLYTKTTVSELKMAAIKEEEDESFHPFEETESEEYIPVFAGGNVSVKGTDRGTAYHNILELLEFDKLLDADDKKKELDEELSSIINKGEMPEADVLKANKKKLLEFLNSETARSMGRACKEGKLYKEQPFVIGVKASTLSSDFPESETVLVQGVIDVYYIEDGKITVLDYKTDKVGNAGELIKRYRTQLDYYAEAIGKLTGLTVSKKLIYSFALSETIEV